MQPGPQGRRADASGGALADGVPPLPRAAEERVSRCLPGGGPTSARRLWVALRWVTAHALSSELSVHFSGSASPGRQPPQTRHSCRPRLPPGRLFHVKLVGPVRGSGRLWPGNSGRTLRRGSLCTDPREKLAPARAPKYVADDMARSTCNQRGFPCCTTSRHPEVPAPTCAAKENLFPVTTQGGSPNAGSD